MKKLLLMMVVALTFMGCHHGNKSDMTNYVVLYYSQTGYTDTLAHDIAGLLDCDAVKVDVEVPYDGDYMATIERCRTEMEDNTLYPILPLDIDINDYDVIFIGYPVWFSACARPIMSLLTDVDFSGKTIVPFCTFGSGGRGASIESIKEICPDADVKDGYGVRAARIDKAYDEVKQFLINEGYLEGEKVELPPYGEVEPVGEEEIAIFDAACSSYRMPLGTPDSYCKRDVEGATDYIFFVTMNLPDGSTLEGQIYVTCPEDGEPEFVLVER